MAILNLPIEQIQIFFFVLVRISAIVFSIPIIDSRTVPFLVKAGLAIAVSVMIMPQLNIILPATVNNPVGLVLGLIGEIAVGVIISLSFQLIITGVQLAGQMAGFQMGIALANVMDPASSLQIPVLSQFLNLFALLVFLAMDAHHYFIRVLVDAFDLIPPLGVHIESGLFDMIMLLAANAFVLGLKIGGPVIIALLLSSVALGLVARTVPQMQIFVVAMPLKILLGLLFLGLSLPFCASFLYNIFDQFGQSLFALIRLM